MLCYYHNVTFFLNGSSHTPPLVGTGFSGDLILRKNFYFFYFFVTSAESGCVCSVLALFVDLLNSS